MPAPRSLQEFTNTPTRIVIFLFVALALIALMGVAVTSRTTQNNSKNNPNGIPQEVITLSPHTLVYGSWSTNSSIISAYDLSTGREGIIASLPIDIKKVSVLDSDNLLYIAEVNTRDHGSEIVHYNLTAKLAQPFYRASDGYYIDDYVISSNGQYVAVWEVQMNEESGTLLNGRSRVVTVRRNSQSGPNIIYDELATTDNPIRYPRAILDNGTVYMDRFLPNSGAGWAYGMSVSNFTGSEKKDLENMQNGSYGTQPVLSPDGKYLAFGGYNGNNGNGTQVVDGVRRSLLSPNTVELLDTASNERIQIENLSSNDIYNHMGWSNEETLLISVLSSDPSKTGGLLVNINSQEVAGLNSENMDTDTSYVQLLQENKWLIGKSESSDSAVGNLGDTYDHPFTELSVYQSDTDSVTKLNTSHQLMQLIAVLPATSFGSFRTLVPDESKTNRNNEDKLQLKTFTLKSELAPTRGVQQSAPPSDACKNIDQQLGKSTSNSECPRCKDLLTSQCGSLKNANNECVQKFKWGQTLKDKCYDSPLYLYGAEGTKVEVSILTPVSQTYPAQDGQFEAMIQKNGNMLVNGKPYDSIDFNYTSALRKITPPTYGSMISANELSNTITKYAINLGLNKKETADLQKYAKSVVTGKYVFVSFFDHETSHAILPITFDPKPDVYRNIVFYFKNLDTPLSYSPEQPKFEKIQRKGFTAIEISGMVE